jgi:hypothetical protein
MALDPLGLMGVTPAPDKASIILGYDPLFRSPYVNYPPYNLISPLDYGLYTDLNKDKTVIKTVVKYFYYKIIDKWLRGDLLPLLGFINVTNDKASLIKDLDQYKLNKDSIENIETKINYIENVLITRDMVKDVLKNIVAKYNIKWYQLYKYEDIIKKRFYKYIKEELEDAIEQK